MFEDWMCERVQQDMSFPETITPSRFRPTVISDMYAQTGDLKLVQRESGHKDVDTTLKYYISTSQNVKAGTLATDALYTQ